MDTICMSVPMFLGEVHPSMKGRYHDSITHSLIDQKKREAHEKICTLRGMIDQTLPINQISSRCIQAAVEVHRHFGPGILEGIYEDFLCHEFDLHRISYKRQVKISLVYKGQKSKRKIVFDLMVVRVQYEIAKQKSLSQIFFCPCSGKRS